MTSGVKTRLERVLLALVLAGACLPAFAFDLPELMALLAHQRSGEARFTEQRFVQGLDGPLSASGTLSFEAPDRFTRKTLQPRAEEMAVQGNTLTLTRNGRTRNLALDATPEMLGVVEAVRGTLTGNAQTLQRHFRTTLSGDAERWTLELTPLGAPLSQQLQAVNITGRRSEVRTIDMTLAGGDRSLMVIEPVQ
jgi:outer membrane lipoprotein-sorting protein